MGEQRQKPGAHAQIDKRGSARERSNEDSLDAPEPTYSEARQRLPDHERTPAAKDADTKVERRASVRPSAFGVPHKSVPPASGGFRSRAESRASTTSDVAPVNDARLEPHQRVLEAARLLDALDPALLDGDASLYAHDVPEPMQRLANQRARGVEHLVAARGAAHEQHLVEARANVAPSAAESRSLADQLAATAPSAPHLLGDAGAAANSLPAAGARIMRRPWLSLSLFGAMVALSVVPLLRYAQSAEVRPAAVRHGPARSPALPPSTTRPTPELRPAASTVTESTMTASTLKGPDRERAIAAALSEGTRALDSGNIGQAERMFGQVIELAEDNPHAAYGLARIRLRQNNLAGAEGWIQSALRKRPRRAAYHQLYADVLTRMGRITEARDEQARAERRDEPAHVRRESEEP